MISITVLIDFDYIIKKLDDNLREGDFFHNYFFLFYFIQMGNPDEWLETVRKCEYLPENDIKKLCEMVKNNKMILE